MKRRLVVSLILVLGLIGSGKVYGQSTVFIDDFARANVSPGGTPQLTYTTYNTLSNTPTISTVSSTLLQIIAASIKGTNTVTGPLASWDATFNPILHNNAGLVTWTFNVGIGGTTASGAFTNSGTSKAIGVILCTSNSTTSTLVTAGTGYAIVNIGGNSGKDWSLVKFSAGIGTTGTALITFTAAGGGNLQAIKVTYDHTTDTWTLYNREEAATGTTSTGLYTDPSAGTYTTVGTAMDNTYTGTTMSLFGFAGVSSSTSSSYYFKFDNFKCTVVNGTAPTVTTGTIGTPTSTGAGITGNNITSIGSANVTAEGIAWSTTTGGEASGTFVNNGQTYSTSSTYDTNLSGLTVNTKYYIKAYATNTAGTSYGSEGNFTTLPGAPAVAAAGTATSSSIICNWTAPSTVGTAPYDYYLEYGTDNTFASTTGNATIASGTLTQSINTGLAAGTTYYYHVRARNLSGSQLGAWSSSYGTTATLISETAPTLSTTTAPTTIGTTSASGAGGTITNIGSGVASSGVCWKTATGPTITDSKVSDGPTTAVAWTNSDLGSSLTANTKYYLKSFAVTAAGTPGYGTEVNFTTKPNTPTSAVNGTTSLASFQVSWTAPTGGSAYSITYSMDYGTTTAYGSSTSASASTSVTVNSGLTGNTLYYYRIHAITTAGNSDYLTGTITTTPSTGKAITVFTILNQVSSYITESTHTINVIMPSGTTRMNLTPSTITVSNVAVVSPASGVSQDFRTAKTYTVTAEDGTTQTYTVNVTNQALITTKTFSIDAATYSSGTSGYELSFIGGYFKNTSGGSTTVNSTGGCGGYTNNVTTTGGIFVYRTDISIPAGSTIALNASGTSSGRTFSSIGTNTSLSGTYSPYVVTGATGTLGSSVCGTISIPMATAISSGTYLQITLSGNINLSSIDITTSNGVLSTQLTTPTIGSASSISSTGFTANWSDVSNEIGYTVNVYKTSDNSLVTSVSAAANATSAPITGLSAATSYYYKVVAIGDGDTYTNSNESSAQSIITSVSGNCNASTIATCATCDVTVANGGSLTVNSSKIYNSVTVEVGGKLTLADGYTLTAPVTLKSGSSGTATFVDANTASNPTAVTGIVEQYLATTRNWYVSSPINNAVLPSGYTSYLYREPGDNVSTSYTGETAYWQGVTTGSSLAPGVGYIAKPSGDAATLTFATGSEGHLNNGDIIVSLSKTGNVSKPGYNLIGNPYPSYLNVLSVLNANASLEKTVWYRTQSTGTSPTYYFETVNTTSGVGTNDAGTGMVTGSIPPMQAFWIKTNAGTTVTFTNAMRSHAGNVTTSDGTVPTTPLKARAVASQQLVRLQISNGTNNDETVIYSDPNAQNGFDVYDSPKMSNVNPLIPEIYTTAGTEKLVINGMNAIPLNQEIGLGFVPGSATSFSLKANEISNIPSDVKVILKDNVTLSETDLTDGTSVYEFTPETTTGNRFSVIFRTSSTVTGIDTNIGGDLSIGIDANNQIRVNGSKMNGGSVTVFNAIGQRLASAPINGTGTVIRQSLSSGVYLVTVTNAGSKTTKKVIIK